MLAAAEVELAGLQQAVRADRAARLCCAAGPMRVCPDCLAQARAGWAAGGVRAEDPDHRRCGRRVAVDTSSRGLKPFLLAQCAWTRPVLAGLMQRIAPVDAAETKQMLHGLDLVTRNGRMGEFGAEGGRSGYIYKRFLKRASYVGAALLQPEAAELLQRLFSRPKLRVASVGGAAGSDVAGLLALREYLRSGTRLSCAVYDYEQGWSPAVCALSAALREHTGVHSGVQFGRCDVRQPLSAPVNRQLAGQQPELLMFWYVLVENYQALREGRFALLRGLLDQANPGTVFVFMDSSFMLWEEIVALAKEAWGGQAVQALYPKHGRMFGNTLILCHANSQ